MGEGYQTLLRSNMIGMTFFHKYITINNKILISEEDLDQAARIESLEIDQDLGQSAK